MNRETNAFWPGWETVRLIGRGSFGAVYEIQRDVFGETEKAALKVISIPQNESDVRELLVDGYDEESISSTFAGHLKSIVTEYSLMRKMNGSANVVNCDDFRYVQHDDGIGWDIFIKMELLTPLADVLSAVIPEDVVIRIAMDMCSALELCDKHNIVHRDIKPQNIFVSPNGDYKLGDFGIAKTVEKTMGGTKTGTYKYMAPEVYSNRPYNSTADIYSLGLVLYWLLNERRMPFMPLPPAKLSAGMDEQSRQRRFSGEQLPPPAHGSEKLKKIVLKACAFDPKDRYTSAAAMLEDINKLDGRMAPVITAAVAGNHTESEEEKTTGPVYGQKQYSDAAVPADCDATVGPVFIHEAASHKLPDTTGQSSDASHYVESAPNYSVAKTMLIAVLAVAIILLLLLLRSCNGAKDHSVENEPSGSSQVTQSKEWSAWTDKLPANISADQYDIEEKILYSSRELEFTSSTETNQMSGWELYDTVAANGGFGPWSTWSAAGVSASATREVETQTRYRYRDKETTTGSSPALDGWTHYDTTHTWGSYGAWSSWSATEAYNSESRMVESKTQYRYRNITYSTEYTDWSAWSAWSFTRQSTSDLKKEDSRNVWGYYYYVCPECGAHMHGWNIYCPTWAGGCGKGWIDDGSWVAVYSTTSWDSAGLKDWYGTGKYYAYVDGQLVFKWTSGGSGTQYRYATRSTQQVANYGSWSGWGDTPYSNSSSRDVQTRTVYRYCDRSQVTTYYFYRWGSWSEWSENMVSGNNDREVENTTFYRYRDQVKQTTYFFMRWSDWTAYSENPITASETREVQTKTQYRYKEK